MLRFGQGIGLGGEWGGAALLATENAPAGKRGWFGMFPQLGPSIGFLASNGLFFALALSLSDEQFRSWGWRVPFLVSAVLVALGLYVRLKIAETPAFQAAIERQERVKVPIATLLSQHWRPTSARRARDGGLLHAVLQRDHVFAVVRRVGAAYSAADVPRPAVHRGGVHGARHAAVGVGKRPLSAASRC